ncbi:bacteriocin-like protein [Chryseobacterium sp.]|uniref:bacteriocin-like protein n=1 Tax=Chryseobacterium sp. TaxID=1871047 RepID=UPI002898B482|nr:hypothetical protein [Chryseobacterium sp.]
MKNFKKLDRNELKTITGNGLLDNIGGVVGGVVGVVGNTVSGIGDVLSEIGTLAEENLCKMQCVVNEVVEIELLACGSIC